MEQNSMLSVIKNMPMQIREAFAIKIKFQAKTHIKKIFVCGMGGSGISGMLLSLYLQEKQSSIPVFVVQDYSIPNFADENSLFFIISYSGNTEESLSCYFQAKEKSKNIVAITTGGTLEELCKKDNVNCIKIPSGYQPRNAVAYLFFPMLSILRALELIKIEKEEIEIACKEMEINSNHLEQEAKKIAEEAYGKIPVIYSSAKYYPIAYRWKCEFNENAKIVSYCHFFPELNHNELNGYENQKMIAPLHIILLKAENDHKRILKRVEITKKLIEAQSDKKIAFSEIKMQGKNALAKIFSSIYLGDLISYHLAMNYRIEPLPVNTIEQFKKEMGPYF